MNDITQSLKYKLARARINDKRNPQGRASFEVQEPGIPEPEGARPLVQPTEAEVCRMKLGVACKVADIRGKDREASR